MAEINIPEPTFLNEIDGLPTDLKKRYESAFSLGRMASLFNSFRSMATRYQRSYSEYDVILLACSNPNRFIEHVTQQMRRYKYIAGYKGNPWQCKKFDELSNNLILLGSGSLTNELRAIVGIGFSQQNNYNNKYKEAKTANKNNSTNNEE